MRHLPRVVGRLSASLASVGLSLLLSVAPALAGAPLLPTRAPAGAVASFPCPREPVSTIDLEACAGRRLLELDRRFDRESDALWPLLDAPGRRLFARANTTWLDYRAEECGADGRAYLGGTAAPVAYADCENELTAARVSEVTDVLALYCQGRTPVGRARGCGAAHSRR